MCKFFSLNSDGKGKIMYFDSDVRKKILSGKLNYETDTHTSIADYFGFKGEAETIDDWGLEIGQYIICSTPEGKVLSKSLTG